MKQILNCAVYTRKSTEEGLEQEFNSLDAQREACEAYVSSQKHEGWKLLPDRYDDGGFSGGNMERPALKRLLADIEAGKVQVVVVYKVDRLTRALADFAKIVERFDSKGVSFVSITQQFNTTSSMGRLTLNVLLSFAQFEREVTSERIRDKVAASKKKGMWMGGVVPYGYDAIDKKLVVNQEEAKLVRHIFERYLEVKTAHDLVDELNAAGYRTKARKHLNGRLRGNNRFWHGPVYLMLQNNLYRGIVAYKGHEYPGEHQAIIDQDLWDKVQKKIQNNRVLFRTKENAKRRSLLSGLVYDADGRRLTSTYTTKRNKQYGYYATPRPNDLEKDGPSYRVSDGYFDHLVCRELAKIIRNKKRVMEAFPDASEDIRTRDNILCAAKDVASTLEKTSSASNYDLIRKLVEKIVISEDMLTLCLCENWRDAVFQMPKEDLPDSSRAALKFDIKIRIIRNGIEKRIILADEKYTDHLVANETLKKALVKAFVWRDQLFGSDAMTMEMIANANGCTPAYISTIIDLSFMSPKVVEAILNDKVPPGLTLQKLIVGSTVDWKNQEKRLES